MFKMSTTIPNALLMNCSRMAEMIVSEWFQILEYLYCFCSNLTCSAMDAHKYFLFPYHYYALEG
jgi:hypothetical protein